MKMNKNNDSNYAAFRMTAPRTLQRLDITLPTEAGLEPDQALVRFEAAAICGSDMPKWTGAEWSDYPTAPGFPLHECVGEVVASNSPGLVPGNLVLAMPLNDFGLQEYFLTNSSQALSVDTDLPPSVIALTQPLSTVIYAVERLGEVKGKTVLVIGLGSLGHLTAWLLKEKGAEVITVDPVPSVLKDTWGFGKHYAMKSEDLAETDLDVTPDIVVEVVGHQAQTIMDAVRLVRRRGTVLLMGVPRPEATLDFTPIFRKNVALISSVTPPWGEYFSKAYELVKAHHEQLEKLITDYIPFSQAASAYEKYEDRASGRLKIAIVKD